jgi:hypothetical protein
VNGFNSVLKDKDGENKNDHVTCTGYNRTKTTGMAKR